MTFGSSKPRVGGDTPGFAPKIKYETPHHHEKKFMGNITTLWLFTKILYNFMTGKFTMRKIVITISLSHKTVRFRGISA